MAKISDHDDVSEIVEIDFEVGHSSIIRSEATTIHNPPRTHDWKVYLRAVDINGDLTCLIQRCVFYLHPEYPNNKRELKSTPFAIQETGYAGFHLPIDIYFKTKKEPKKFRIEYDLDLHKNIDGHPYRQKESYVRKYRCTFYNPDSEFRQKILAAGGKIVDSGPIASNNTDTDESDINEKQVSIHEPVIRQSPQQKRPSSPVATVNVINNKKIKLEQSTNDIKKKPVQSIIKNENISKTTVNSKSSKLVSHKSSSILETKTTKNLSTKESNQPTTTTTTTNNDKTENLSLSKTRPSTKLIKSQSTNDIKSSIQSILNNTKKKEQILSPSKPKPVTNTQNGLKKSINKNSQKSSIKTEQTLTSTTKSSSNIIIKQESLSQSSSSTNISSNNTNTSIPKNNFKKIPKKPLPPPPPPPPIVEKHSRSSISSSTSSSLNRNSIRDSKGQQLSVSKTQSNLKRDRSLSSINISNNNNNNQSRKTNITKNHSIHQSSNSSQHDKSNRISSSPHKSSSKNQIPTPPKFIHSPSQSHIDTPQSSSTNSPPPSTQIFQNEDNHIQASMDIDNDHLQLSDESNSPHEQILVQPIQITSNQISHSEQSDTNDSDISIDDINEEEEDEEEDLPTSLTNDDLRYKLIYIYKRFQLNSINDLTIFVRFFKRHQLIDISSLSMTKAKNDMFTYDLFSLSPSHIGELANDLGYTTTNIINSKEQ
ncbi:unnamed protein product [Rotaria sordida]|uniref:YEATS domain-containing protein n=1 Tax=Rotaria sordida TaxID=392033 RepID=A0A813XTD5_9BILA|nr:unnamed protein product [Rotaria sordida]